ncbi:MAG: hypothetical protein K940chlam7_01058 [Chlamydiae bacterium]|nr:hypothetical protein [Chlamydiota bacterium]
MLDTFIQKLTKELEIEGALATEVPGVYALPVDKDLSMTISEIPRGFSLNCILIDCPTEQEEAFYTQTLFANLFGQGTEGCVLGLDAEGKTLTLSREVNYDIEYKDFRDMVEDFMNSIDFWRQEILAYGIKLE